MRQIYEAMVGDLASALRRWSAAIAKATSAEVRRLGHAIKGGCGMAGALQAARPGRETGKVPIGPRVTIG